MLSLADVPVKTLYPGQPLFESGRAVEPSTDPIVVVCSRVSSITVDGRWRLHVPRQHRLDARGVQMELYDLESDPFELEPIDDPGRIDQLYARLVDWERANAPEGLRQEDIAVDPALFLKLHQLGYGGEAEHVKEFVKSMEERIEKERIEEERDAGGDG